ncbi:BgTH12-06395 [Blumeria graminis f. sp. triticale]|uniref:BgTH12-06395 n=2 Tax=Blumeria graminis TaxID=34373 RepID=A0A9W4D2E1_BLUGR|nr:BgTH12-06395 [Blumeria graminis f. sp. triticale]
MIRCAVAFLLIAGESSNRLDRLVVTTDEVDKPSYGVYEVKDRDHFPHSEFIDAPMLIKTKITRQGTYYMPYCSDYLQSVEIARFITKGLTEITQLAHLGLTHDTRMEKKCLTYLSSIYRPELEIILDLAFKGIIAVDGPYKAFAPQMADQPIVVTHDQPMEMRSLVLNGEMFARSGTELEQNALAWYHGHLHLFKQNLKTSEWTPVTQIGSEVENGSLITNHILEALPNSKRSWTEFYEMKKDIIEAYEPPNSKGNTRYDIYSKEIYNFLNSIEIHDINLLHNYPFLDFEYSRYLSDIYKNSPYYLGKKLRTLRHLLTWSRKVYHQRLISFRVMGTTGPFEEKKTT